MRPIWQICIPSARCNREISATEPNKVPQRIWQYLARIILKSIKFKMYINHFMLNFRTKKQTKLFTNFIFNLNIEL